MSLAAGSTASVVEPVALGVGQPAPALSGTTLDGGRLDLAAFRGRPVVVNFWASWCVPCRDEFPIFKSALERHAADRLVVLGVVFKDGAEPAAAFAHQFGATWQSLTDPSGSLAHAYRVVAPPQTYFIDRSGVVRERQIGQLASDAEFDGLLATALR